MTHPLILLFVYFDKLHPFWNMDCEEKQVDYEEDPVVRTVK